MYRFALIDSDLMCVHVCNSSGIKAAANEIIHMVLRFTRAFDGESFEL